MLNRLMSLFFTTAEKPPQKRPLTLSMHYPAANTSKHTTVSINQLCEDVSNLTENRGATVSVCKVPKNTNFTAFNRPKKTKGHFIVYPDSTNQETSLFKVARHHNLSVATVKTREDVKCLQVAKGSRVHFLIEPTAIRLHKWLFKPTPKEKSTTLINNKGLKNLRNWSWPSHEERSEPRIFLPQRVSSSARDFESTPRIR